MKITKKIRGLANGKKQVLNEKNAVAISLTYSVIKQR